MFVTASYGQIYVVNIDPEDRPKEGESNLSDWWEQIGALATATGAMGLAATSDPLKMTFTNGSSLTDAKGFGVLEITNDYPLEFEATANYLNLGLNFATDYFDVDEGVAVTVMKDGEYAFVAGRDTRGNAGTSFYPDKREGGNIGIIKDPLGDNPRLVAATRPIPGSVTNNVSLTGDDKFLLASYPTLSGGGAVYGFDVGEIIETVESLELKASGEDGGEVYWLDSFNRGEGSVAFDEGSQREATLGDLEILPIDDINPEISVAADYEIIGLNWVNQWVFGVPEDTSRAPIGIGGNPFGMTSVSVRDSLELVSPGENGTADSLTPTFEWAFKFEDGEDTEDDCLLEVNPDEVEGVNLYVSAFPEGEGLLPEDSWEGLQEQDSINDYNPNRVLTARWQDGMWTWNGGSLQAAVSSESPLPERFSLPLELQLTGGQTYHWAVEVVTENGEEEAIAGQFDTTLGEIDGTGGSNTFSSVTVLTRGSEPRGEEIDSQLESMADYIARTGLGLVMHYKASTGKWYWEDSMGVNDIPFDLRDKPLFLIPGWEQIPEQTNYNSGFTEAAADSLLASLVTLNYNFGNDMLFNSPWHFVGFGRGTIVNSEIVQRLGTFFPKEENPNKFPDLQMTTIDIPESEQGSLFSNLRVVNEPEVKVWDNVTYADNYYQTSVLQSGDFTTTPAGSSLPGADWEVFLGGTNSSSSRMGFDSDDRRASPHKRALAWYAGTTDLSQRHVPPLQEFVTLPGIDNPEKEPIYRRLGDLDLSEQNADREETWYTPDYRGSSLAHGSQNAPWEGIGTGWFYSVLGGGMNKRHDALLGDRTPVSEDNTALARMRGDFAVPTLFNGNFDAITERRPTQSIPGWSFYNGDEPDALQEHLVEWRDIPSLNEPRIIVGYEGRGRSLPITESYLQRLGIDSNSPVNYALRLQQDRDITHNRFIVPESGALRFDLHVPEFSGGRLLVTLQAEDEDIAEVSSFIELTRADRTRTRYLQDTQKIDYGNGGFESFYIDVPDSLRGRIATLNFEVAGSATVYLDNIFFGSEHLLFGNPSNARNDAGDRNNYLLEKPQFATAYNDSTKTPLWVSWQLNRKWLGGVPRSQINFIEDPSVPENWGRITHGDYNNSYYSRGHMMPSSHRTNSEKDNISSFLMTNIVPQHNDNNIISVGEIPPSPAWTSFDATLQEIVNTEPKELYIVAGGYGSNLNPQRLTHNSRPSRLTNPQILTNKGINIPGWTWKVVLELDRPGLRFDDIGPSNATAYAILIPNEVEPAHEPTNPDGSVGNNGDFPLPVVHPFNALLGQTLPDIPNKAAWRNWETWQLSVNELETLTELDFFSNIPELVEEAIEA